MLDNLRRLGRTWVGKLLGAFLLVGLAGFGISNELLNFGGNNVARVGDQDITAREFQRAYSADLERVTMQIGQTPGPQEALAMGIPSGTLGRLAAEAALNQMGERMGVGVSEERLSQMLRQDPSFAGTLGQFDPSLFRVALQRSGYTEAEYFDLQTKAARRQQISASLFADSAVPEAARDLLNRYSGDTRTIDYFVMNAQSIPPVAEPTEEDLANYLSEHQNEFRTLERRTADILVLTLDALAASKEITDEEVAAEYERTSDSRMRVEKRTIRQAPLVTEAQQGWFERGKTAGKSFDQLVAEAGIEVTDLGTLGRGEITDTTLADAAFGLELGDFAIIPGVGGRRAVSVTDIEPGGQISLDEARDEIRRSLALARARGEYLDILDQVEELRAAFQPLDQIAERYSLPLYEVTLTASGAELAEVAEIAPEQRGRVASAVFAAEEDKLTPTVAISNNNNVFVSLKAIEPARDQTLDEVRDEIVAALTDERTEEALAAEVESILDRLQAGEAFADVAASLNQFPFLSEPFNRSGTGTPIINQDVAMAAFAGGPGHFGSAVNGDGDHVLFEVVDITPAAEGQFAEAAEFLEDLTRQSLYSDFISALRDEAGIRVNQQTLNQILALDSAGQ